MNQTCREDKHSRLRNKNGQGELSFNTYWQCHIEKFSPDQHINVNEHIVVVILMLTISFDEDDR